MNERILFLGCGVMGGMIARGIKASSAMKILAYTPGQTRAKELVNELNGLLIRGPKDLGDEVDLVVIACKPQQFEDLIEVWGQSFSKKTLLLSVMAGVSLEKIKSAFSCDQVARIMPTTPMSIGEGIIPLVTGTEVSAAKEQWLIELFSKMGKVVVMDNQKQLDEVTLVSGCGPGYLLWLAQSMIEYLNAKGLDKEMAKTVVLKTFMASADWAMVNKDDEVVNLISRVCSKGGVTQAIVDEMNNQKLNERLKSALDAGSKRSSELCS